jgi:hypothetical protein
MTDDRSVERAARSWIEVGPTTAPPHVVDAALSLIERTPQERDWLVPWRHTNMTSLTRYAAAAAIGVLLISGAIYLSRTPDQGIAAPPPSSAPATPKAAAAAPATQAPPTPSPIPRPSAAIDQQGAEAVARQFQDLINASRTDEAADLIWVGARVAGTPTFSREDVVSALAQVCAAEHLGTWPAGGNNVRWDVKLKDRPGFSCPETGEMVETLFVVENGLIVEYRPIHARYKG